MTTAFVHLSLWHIAFNMIGLVTFGHALESYWGEQRLFTIYVVSVVTAGLAQLYAAELTGLAAPTVGASGGVFGLLLAFAVLFPQQRLALMFIPIPIPARVFAVGYAALELYQGVTTRGVGVAHFAHLGGMVGAAALIFLWRHSDVRR